MITSYGINALLKSDSPGYRQSGISRYVDRLITHLVPMLNDDERLIAYCAPGVRFAGTSVDTVEAPDLVHRPAGRIAWEQLRLPSRVSKDALSLLHGPANTLPQRLTCPGVVTIHDLAFMRWPEQITRRRFAYLTRALRSSVERAAQIIAVSEATRNDIVSLLNVPAERIAVIPLGVDPRFRPGRGELKSGRPYIIAVGTLEPRKNIPALLEAFGRVTDDIPHDLILIGADGWLTDEIRIAATNPRLRNRLQLTGFVSNEHLVGWYRGADLFVIPSLYEGFGLTLLEAMSCGVPAIASNVSSLPEVGGDAVDYFDPRDVHDISRALVESLQNLDRIEQLRIAGPLRAAAFTWDRTAQATLDVYRQVRQ